MERKKIEAYFKVIFSKLVAEQDEHAERRGYVASAKSDMLILE